MTSREKLQEIRRKLDVHAGDQMARCAIDAVLEMLVEAGPAVVEDLGELRGARPHIGRGGDVLAPGDVVRLRSGGPAMTVLSQRPASLEEIGGWLVCHYFDATALTSRSTTLPPAALVRVEGDLGILRDAWVALDAVNVAAERTARGDELTDVEQHALHALVVDARAAIGDRLGKAGQ